MEDCAQSMFLGSWALVVPHLCSKFYIFDRPILEEFLTLRGGAYLLQSHLRVTQNGLLPTTREMHLSSKNLAIISPLGL